MKKQDQAAKLKNQSSALSLSLFPPLYGFLSLLVCSHCTSIPPSLSPAIYTHTFFFHLTVPVLITPGPKRTEVSDKSVLLRWKPRSCSLQLSVPLSLSECRGGGGVTQRSELPYYVLHIKIQHLIVTSTIYLRANVRVVPAALCL